MVFPYSEVGDDALATKDANLRRIHYDVPQ